MITIQANKLFELWGKTTGMYPSFADFCNVLQVSPEEICKGSCVQIQAIKVIELWRQICCIYPSFTDFCNVLQVLSREIYEGAYNAHLEVLTETATTLDTPTETPTEEISGLATYQKMISHFASIGDSNSFLEKLYTESVNLIDLDTLAPYWNYVMTLNEPKLCLAYLNFFCKNIEAIKKSDATVQALSADVMKYVTASEDISLEEIEIFQIAHKWIQLVKPTEEITRTVINNIRLPLIETKRLIQDVQPSGLINDKAYIEAINHSVVPCKDATGKNFQPRNQPLTADINFYLCNHAFKFPEYRTITDDDITPKFISCLRKYISKNGSIPALDAFETKTFCANIRASDHFLIIDGLQAHVSNQKFNANDKCQIYSYPNDKIIEKIDNIVLGQPVGSYVAVGIFVKKDVKF